MCVYSPNKILFSLRSDASFDVKLRGDILLLVRESTRRAEKVTAKGFFLEALPPYRTWLHREMMIEDVLSGAERHYSQAFTQGNSRELLLSNSATCSHVWGLILFANVPERWHGFQVEANPTNSVSNSSYFRSFLLNIGDKLCVLITSKSFLTDPQFSFTLQLSGEGTKEEQFSLFPKLETDISRWKGCTGLL